jgi:hypothetical protein
MKIRNRKALLSMLMGTGLYLLDPLRHRIADRLDDLGDRAQDTYDTTADRLSRASRVMRGTDRRGLSTTAAVLLGIGVGVGVALLFIPGGSETRSPLPGKVRDFGDRASQAS